MQWYYLDDQRQQMESDEETLRRMSASGELPPDTLVWNDSLTGWAPLKRVFSGSPLTRAQADETGTQILPYQAPAGSLGASHRALATILAREAGWTRLLAVLVLLAGLLTLPLGLFGIWMSVVLFRIAHRAKEAKRTGSERALRGMLEGTALLLKAIAIFSLIVLLLGLTVLILTAITGIPASLLELWSRWGLPEIS